MELKKRKLTIEIKPMSKQRSSASDLHMLLLRYLAATTTNESERCSMLVDVDVYVKEQCGNAAHGARGVRWTSAKLTYACIADRHRLLQPTKSASQRRREL